MKGKYIVYIIIAVIMLMSGAAYWIQTNARAKITPQIMEQLIIPYQRAISARDYTKAYNEFTSNDYKSKFTLEQYLNAQDSNFAIYGSLDDLKPVSGVFLKETATGNKIIFKATFAYIGSKKHQRIIVDVINEKGKFRLYNTYNSYVSMGGLLPVIY